MKRSAPMRRTRECQACQVKKHTQCRNVLDAYGKCACTCYRPDGTGPEFWAMTETAKAWPEVAAAHALIASSLRICWAKS